MGVLMAAAREEDRRGGCESPFVSEPSASLVCWAPHCALHTRTGMTTICDYLSAFGKSGRVSRGIVRGLPCNVIKEARRASVRWTGRTKERTNASTGGITITDYEFIVVLVCVYVCALAGRPSVCISRRVCLDVRRLCA